MSNYLAAIDAGTGGVRCVIFDTRGNAISQDYRELQTLYFPDGRAEQDPVQLIRGAWDAVRGAIAKGNVDASRIAGVTATGTQTTFAPVDRDGRFLTNIILWQDARGLSMFPWIRSRLAERGMTEADLYRRTLRPLDALLEGAKLLWLRKHEPALFDSIHALVNPQSIVLKAFGADKHTVDPSDMGWWLSHDAVTLRPDPVLLQLFDLNPGLLPPLRAPGALVGRVTPEAAARTGLRPGTALYQGAVDQCCAALGAGNCGAADMVTMCIGTAGVVITVSEVPIPDPLSRYYVIHYPGGGYASEIAVPVAASAFRWVRDILYAGEDNGEIYHRMDTEAAGVPIGSGGLCFLPFLAGSTYPRADDAMRGGWVGASLSTNRATLIRSALEGICFEMGQLLEATGQEFTSIRVLGGATRSELWNQMLADICGCPVETIACQEASALGAAMIAAHGAGLYSSLKDAVRGMAHMKRRYEPGPDAADRYADCRRAWLCCAESLSREAFPALARVRGK
ncbi:MAG: FGGY family carbohydrate kinase [Clostridia bacterium]|nr:FGGY family carbohydrate kinase [Clostridia bacterium]